MTKPFDHTHSEIMDQLDLISRYEAAEEAIASLTILRQSVQSESMNRMYAQLIIALQRKISFHRGLLQRATNTN